MDHPHGTDPADRVTAGGRIWAGLASVGIAAVLVLLVYQRAWVSDDALITLRYVQNTLEGLGPVYNPGEAVQGYTHPLWFLLLVAGTRVYSDPYAASIVLGLLLTGATAACLTWSMWPRDPGAPPLPPAPLLGCVMILASSGTWLSFQTGGLENALTHFLLAVWILLLMWPVRARPGPVVLLASFLCLSRPDLVWLVAPATLVVMAPHRADLRDWGRVSLAVLPAIAWMVFAQAFYGTPVPNTAAAKLGIFSNRGDALAQGLTYVLDWAVFEPVALIAAIAGVWTLVRRKATSPLARPLALGIGLQAGWVVWIGGDFMRGRMVLPVFTGAVVGAAILMSRSTAPRRIGREGAALGLLGLALLGAALVAPVPAPGTNAAGIADEWLAYPGYHLRQVRTRGELYPDEADRDLARALASFVARCGPTTLHSDQPAYLAFTVGPELRIVDVLGLTNAFVARLPSETLVQDRPRPGHPYKAIPREYLWSLGDVGLVEGWERAVRAGDCTLRERAVAGPPPTGDWIPAVPSYSPGS